MPQSSPGSVFVYTIHSELSPDQLAGYRLLQQQMDEAARGFQGYLGQEIVDDAALNRETIQSTVRIRFQSLESCLTWLDSGVRRSLLQRAEAELQYRYHSRLDSQSFDQWISAGLPQHTPVWKINLIVWLALYPSVMALIWIGQPTLARLPLPLNMLISNALTVALTGWVLVPWLSKVYSDWLTTRSKRLNLLGSVSVMAWLFLALALFSLLPGTPWASSVSPR